MFAALAPVRPSDPIQLIGSELVPVPPPCASTTELFTEFHTVTPVKTCSHQWGYPSVNNDLFWFTAFLLSLLVMHGKARNQLDLDLRLTLQGWQLGKKNACKMSTFDQESLRDNKC